MYPKILVATDLSAASFEVVKCLKGLQAFGVKDVLLLHSLPFSAAASLAFSYDPEQLDRVLEEQKSILAEQGFKVTVRTETGAPKREITRIAREEDYALIVVGSRGQSLDPTQTLGGVAYGVLHLSNRPVLIIPVFAKDGTENECRPVDRCGFVQHALFATDFSEASDQAFTHLLNLVGKGLECVTLAHVQDKTRLERHLGGKLEEFNRIDKERLEEHKARLLDKGATEVDIQLSYGVPHQEIARLVNDLDVQLVVMGTQGRSFIGEIFLGSVSHNVLRHSVAPVLLTPSHR